MRCIYEFSHVLADAAALRLPPAPAFRSAARSSAPNLSEQKSLADMFTFTAADFGAAWGDKKKIADWRSPGALSWCSECIVQGHHGLICPGHNLCGDARALRMEEIENRTIRGAFGDFGAAWPEKKTIAARTLKGFARFVPPRVRVSPAGPSLICFS